MHEICSQKKLSSSIEILNDVNCPLDPAIDPEFSEFSIVFMQGLVSESPALHAAPFQMKRLTRLPKIFRTYVAASSSKSKSRGHLDIS